jgi:hypothetical protein
MTSMQHVPAKASNQAAEAQSMPSHATDADHASERPQSHAETLGLAERWFDGQCAALARRHGSAWPKHREWVEAFLREELRQRLAALGWSAKK